MNAIAKITGKGQTTVLLAIRKALHVKPGDLIPWELLADGQVRVRRIEPADVAYLRALEGTLGEWPPPRTRPPTVTFEAWEVVRVPSPLPDRETSKNRPALVLSAGEAFFTPAGPAVLAMITSRQHGPGA